LANLQQLVRLHGGLAHRILAVLLHEEVGGSVGIGSACEVATEEQEQHDGDHRQEHCQAMLA
jgi:hypothetical protein